MSVWNFWFDKNYGHILSLIKIQEFLKIKLKKVIELKLHFLRNKKNGIKDKHLSTALLCIYDTKKYLDILTKKYIYFSLKKHAHPLKWQNKKGHLTQHKLQLWNGDRQYNI